MNTDSLNNKGDKPKTLYKVKFIDQSSGATIDSYFLAYGLSQLEENIGDIIAIKVIAGINDLTKEEN